MHLGQFLIYGIESHTEDIIYVHKALKYFAEVSQMFLT